MSNSEASWLKKFLGEDPNLKALRERLEEATGLIESKDAALAQQEQRIEELNGKLTRETSRAEHLEGRVKDLLGVVSETELSRNVTEELLNQAEAQSSKAAADLAEERKNLASANLAKSKAEASAKYLTTQYQKIEKQTTEMRASLSRMEDEGVALRAKVAALEGELSECEQQRQQTANRLTECLTELETQRASHAELTRQLAAFEASRAAQAREVRVLADELSSCRGGFLSLFHLVTSVAHTSVGRAVPVAVRLSAAAGANTSAPLEPPAEGAANTGGVKQLERTLTAMGLPNRFEETAGNAVALELSGATFDDPALANVGGQLLGGWVARHLTRSTSAPYEVETVTTQNDHWLIRLKKSAD